MNAGANKILAILKKEYPPKCALTHKSALQLLTATILSAQCTDKRVNEVTPVLFHRYPTVNDLASANRLEVEEIIRTTGFFRAKTKSVIGMAKGLIEHFGGKVPQTIEELVTLPGVGRKTANVVLAEVFDKAEGVVVDTHIKRVAFRLGLTKQTDPEKVEADLMKLFPQKEWISVGNALIWHGRKVCDARKPDCPSCAVNKLCPSATLFLNPPAKAKRVKKA
jgi:endonuclease-3